MAGGKHFKHIFEGESVEGFMAGLVPGDAAREKLAAEGVDVSRLPKTIDDVLQDVKNIWQEKGYMTPAALEAALIEKYIPDADPRVLSFIRDVECARNAPDFVTDYLPKEHAYAATGLAHLYALETGKPMAMAEIDFSNMGGTNDYFREMLAKERGVAVNDIDAREARAMTDQAVLVLCAGMTKDLQGELPKGASITPIRTGGDELRILISGVTGADALANIAEALHTGIEMRVAEMGLQDHPHLKDPKNPVRNGFGAALAMQDMAAIVKTNALIQELDAEISDTKKRIGLLRLGRIDEAAQAAGWEAMVDSGRLQPPAGQDKMDVVGKLLARDREHAKEVSDALHIMNPQHNSTLAQGSKGFAQVVLKELPSDTAPPEKLFPYVPLREDLTHKSLSAAPLQAGVDAMASLEERRAALVANEFNAQGVTMNGAHKFMLERALGGLAADDPAAGVKMPQVMAPTMDAWAKDAANSNDKPQAMVVSFHNLAGLNGALGHHYSDIVLRHMAQGIIRQSLHDAGMPATAADKTVVAHEGGANFTVVVPGNAAITPQVMKAVESNIARHTADLNKAGIALFLVRGGVTETDRLRDYLQRERLDAFSAIKDPKARTMEISGMEVTGRVNGLGVVTATLPVDGKMQGYALLDNLRQQAEKKMTQFRQGALINDFMSGVLRRISLREEFNTVANGSHFHEAASVYRVLPATVQPNMPPEVQSLVEIKTQNLADGKGKPSRTGMRAFERQYNQLMQDGGLVEVGKWLDKNGAPMVPKPTTVPPSRFAEKQKIRLTRGAKPNPQKGTL